MESDENLKEFPLESNGNLKEFPLECNGCWLLAAGCWLLAAGCCSKWSSFRFPFNSNQFPKGFPLDVLSIFLSRVRTSRRSTDIPLPHHFTSTLLTADCWLLAADCWLLPAPTHAAGKPMRSKLPMKTHESCRGE